MNQPKLFLKALATTAFIALASIAASAQVDKPEAKESNFEIALHVVLGSNDTAARSDLPASLANVSKRIRSAVPYTSYRVTNTYLARVGNMGSFEYKSVADLLGQSTTGSDPASFLQWSVGELRRTEGGSAARTFRFGARVPIKTVVLAGEAATPRETVAYESIGLDLTKVGVADNVPTLLGSLMVPRSNSTLFLIVTVTRTDR